MGGGKLLVALVVALACGIGLAHGGACSASAKVLDGTKSLAPTSCPMGEPERPVLDTDETRSFQEVVADHRGFLPESVTFLNFVVKVYANPESYSYKTPDWYYGSSHQRQDREAAEELGELVNVVPLPKDKEGWVAYDVDVGLTSLVFTNSPEMVQKLLKRTDRQWPVLVEEAARLDPALLARGLRIFRDFYRGGSNLSPVKLPPQPQDPPQLGLVRTSGWGAFTGGMDYSTAREWVEVSTSMSLVPAKAEELKITLTLLVVSTLNVSITLFQKSLLAIRDVFVTNAGEDSTALLGFDGVDKSDCWTMAWMAHLWTRSDHSGEAIRQTIESPPPVLGDSDSAIRDAVRAGVKHFLIVDDNTCTGSQMTENVDELWLVQNLDNIDARREGRQVTVTVAIAVGTEFAAQQIAGRIHSVCKARRGVQRLERTLGVAIKLKVVCRNGIVWNILVARVILSLGKLLGRSSMVLLHRNSFLDDWLNPASQVVLRLDWKIVDAFSSPKQIVRGSIPTVPTEDTNAYRHYRWIAPACPPYKKRLAARDNPPGKVVQGSKGVAGTVLTPALSLRLYCDRMEENLNGPSFAWEGLRVHSSALSVPDVPTKYYPASSENNKEDQEVLSIKDKIDPTKVAACTSKLWVYIQSRNLFDTYCNSISHRRKPPYIFK